MWRGPTAGTGGHTTLQSALTAHLVKAESCPAKKIGESLLQKQVRSVFTI